MPNCRHHGCRRILKGFQGPRRCEDCSPPLPHLISDFGSITSHTPGNNDDTDVNRNDGDDNGNSDSKRKTRSSNRLLYEKGLALFPSTSFRYTLRMHAFNVPKLQLISCSSVIRSDVCVSASFPFSEPARSTIVTLPPLLGKSNTAMA